MNIYSIINYFLLYQCDDSRQIKLQLKSPLEIFTITVDGKTKNFSNLKKLKLIEVTFCTNSYSKIKYLCDDKYKLILKNPVEKITFKIETSKKCKRFNLFNIKKLEIIFDQDIKTLIQYSENLLEGNIILRQEDDRSIIHYEKLKEMSDPYIWNYSNCIDISFEAYQDTIFTTICKDGNGKKSLKNIRDTAEKIKQLQKDIFTK